MFRLELLENIFSLLFLSTSDFTLQTQKDTNTNLNTTTLNQERSSHRKNSNIELEAKLATDEIDHSTKEKQKVRTCSSTATYHNHLDLGHLIQGCKGFLADITAMEGFLRLLKEGLEGMCVVGQQDGGRAPARQAEAVENLGCSVTAETFGARLQKLSKRTAEAQWRLQIITSNWGSESGETTAFSFQKTCGKIGHFMM